MAILKNKRRRIRVFNLDAPFFVKNRNETLWGKPCSLTLLALEQKEVHDAVLSCTEVKAALAKGDVRELKPSKEKQETVSAAPSVGGSSLTKKKKAAK